LVYAKGLVLGCAVSRLLTKNKDIQNTISQARRGIEYKMIDSKILVANNNDRLTLPTNAASNSIPTFLNLLLKQLQ